MIWAVRSLRFHLTALAVVLVATTVSAQEGNPLAPRPSSSENPLARPDPFAGTFRGDELSVELRRAGTGYEGSIQLGDQSFPASAKREGDAVTGTFRAGGEDFPFRATLDGDAMTLESGGAKYELVKVGATGGGATVGKRAEDERDGAGAAKSVAPPGVDMKTYKHPLGYVFQYPKSWQVQGTDMGLLILPDDAKKDEAGQPLELFILSGEEAPGIERPDDPQVGAFFDTTVAEVMPFLRRKGETKSLGSLLGPGAVFGYEGTNPMGRKIQATVYVTLHRGNGIFLLHLSDASLHGPREPVARYMFSSFGFERGETDPAVVGDWGREEMEGSSFDPITGGVGASTKILYRFEKDGTCWVGTDTRFFGTVQGAGGSVTVDDPGGRGNTTRGMWGVRDGKLSILWEGGGADVFEYRVFDHQGSPALKLVAGGGKPKYFTKR